jgi:cephalosporin hydroxylase
MSDDPTTAAGFKAAQFVRAEWAGLETQHRYEDLLLIADLLRHVRPRTILELGTAAGGFALFLGHHR